MVCKLNYKKIIIGLMIFLILTGGVLWYREEITNKEAPKKAQFVENNLDWSKIYG